MIDYRIIDCDTHLTEPRDVWTSRVPAKYRELVPHVQRDDTGRDIWVIQGERVSHVGLTATAGWHEPFPSGPLTFEECVPAAYDAAERLRYMDDHSVWAQVLYPNVGGFGSQRFLMLEDNDLKVACVRAYNDFQRDWVEPDPRRFVTMIATPFWDINATVAEIERGASLGHRGILFTGEPHAFGLPVLGDRHWDPLWAVARDTGLPVHFHIGSGDLARSVNQQRTKIYGRAMSYAYVTLSLFLNNGMQVADLLVSGVLPRFPDVRFVSVESGIGWIPFVLEACDYQATEADVADRALVVDKPSALFRRQVFACFWFETVAPAQMLAHLPIDNLLFETDFPHPTCLYDNIDERIEASLGHHPESLRRKILWDNAAALYHIEAPVNAEN